VNQVYVEIQAGDVIQMDLNTPLRDPVLEWKYQWSLLEDLLKMRKRWKNKLWSLLLELVLETHNPQALKKIKTLQRQKKYKEAQKLKEKTVKDILGEQAYENLKRLRDRVYFRKRPFNGNSSNYPIPPDTTRYLELSINALEKNLSAPPDYPNYLFCWLMKFRGINKRTAYQFINKFFYHRNWNSRSALEKFAALHVNKGEAVKKRKGVSADFDMKSFLILLATNLIKQRDPEARKVYEETKREFRKKHPDYPPKRIDRHAIRILAKRMLCWAFEVDWFVRKGKIPRPMHTANAPLNDNEIEPPPYTDITLEDYMTKKETREFYQSLKQQEISLKWIFEVNPRDCEIQT